MQTQASPLQRPPLIQCVMGPHHLCAPATLLRLGETHLPYQAPGVTPNITAHGSRSSFASWRRPRIAADGPRPSPCLTSQPPKLAADHRPQASEGEGRQHPRLHPSPRPLSGPGILVAKVLLPYFPSPHKPKYKVHESGDHICFVHHQGPACCTQQALNKCLLHLQTL